MAPVSNSRLAEALQVELPSGLLGLLLLVWSLNPNLGVPAGRILASPQALKHTVGEIAEGKKYTSESGLFSVVVPAAGNPFVHNYKWYGNWAKYENYDYEEVRLVISDFGQAYVAGVRRIPQAVLAQMAKEEPKQTLSNLANKALVQWVELTEEPEVVEETWVKTQFGEGLLRVYLAKRGSLMGRVEGADEAGKPKTEKFDTHIAVIAVKKGDRFLYATAQDDYLQTKSTTGPTAPFNPIPQLRETLQSFLASMKAKI
jgi:hypothetical protein